MYDQSLPPSPDSVESAGVWARNIARRYWPRSADDLERAARNLVSQAVPLTPPGQQIRVTLHQTEDGWLRIEVRTPGRRLDLVGGWEYAETSAMTTRLGSSDGPGGHVGWVELPAQLAVSA